MRLRYAAANASEVTAPAASARISAAMACSAGSKAWSAARSSPTAAASDTAPVVVRKPRRSMNYPLWYFGVGRAAGPVRSRRGQTLKVFSAEFFTVLGGFVTYSYAAMRYLIYRERQI